jgi:hypothetical protein
MPTYNATTYNLRMSPRTMRKLQSIARERSITVRELIHEGLKPVTGVDDSDFFHKYTPRKRTDWKPSR